jgi:RNA polymerase sigma-70 factor (ECF subfamily)
MRLPPEFSDEDRVAASCIIKMARGEQEALNALYGLYHRPLYGLISAILRDNFATEEVLQDTFVRAYRNASRYDPEIAAPFPWLVTIGRRLAIDRLRKSRSRPVFLPDYGEQLGGDGDKEAAANGAGMDGKLEASWMRERLRLLTPAQREAIQLAYFHGFTQTEIAEKLDRPLGTVKSDLARGLMRLRQAWLKDDER